MTVAQLLKTTKFPLRLYDSKGKLVYYEGSNKYWYRHRRDEKGNIIYCEDSNEFWYRYELDERGKPLYFENSNNYWIRRERDDKGNVIYCENSNGAKYGTPLSQSCSGKVVEIDGVKYKLEKMK